jgi:hypothetical protein
MPSADFVTFTPVGLFYIYPNSFGRVVVNGRDIANTSDNLTELALVFSTGSNVQLYNNGSARNATYWEITMK